jgi:hypothetical protein
MGLGFTYVVYRLPRELRWADGRTVVRAVRAEHPRDDAKVTQWHEHGLTTRGPELPEEQELRVHVESNAGYPNTLLVRGELVQDRCPYVDPGEWLVLDQWDSS